MTAPVAQVLEVDGHLVLSDPAAEGVAYAVARHNCRGILLVPDMRARVEHFARRVRELGDDGTKMAVVVINADDRRGRLIADSVMPNHDWSAIRARGEVPFARGIVDRISLQMALDAGVSHADTTAAELLRAVSGIAVIVVDHDVVAVFPLVEAFNEAVRA